MDDIRHLLDDNLTAALLRLRHLGGAVAVEDLPGAIRDNSRLANEADDIQATAAFTAVVRRLVNAGHKADCVSAWNGEAHQIRTQQVDLSAVPDDEFRFFENYHFVFTSSV